MAEFLKRADYDYIIKEFYTEVKKQTENFTDEQQEVVLLMTQIFDSVINGHKKLTKD